MLFWSVVTTDYAAIEHQVMRPKDPLPRQEKHGVICRIWGGCGQSNYAELLAGDAEEIHAPLHVFFSSCTEGAVIGKQEFVDEGCGYTRLEVHPPVLEEVAIRPSFTIHRVEGFRQIHEGRVQVGPHLVTLLLKLAGGEDHVRGPTVTTESALAVEENASEGLAGDVQQRNASVLVTDSAVPIPLVEMHGCGVLEVIHDFCLTQYLLQERCQMAQELGTTVPVDLSRDRLRSGRFHAGDLGISFGAGKRSSSFGWRTVDSLDGGGGIIQFVAIRVPLNFLGLASRLSVLHLTQPLLHKAATMVEGCFVVVGRAIDVGFLQAVLLGEEVADGGVIVTKPVQMLAACSTVYSQGGRPEYVSQLTPSVLHTNQHLGDDEAMVGPPVSTRNRLCHRHVPLVSPPTEYIIQQEPQSRPRMHREAEEGVRQATPTPITTLTQSLSEKISSTVDSSCSLAVSVSSDPDVSSLPRSNSSAITIVTPATESSSSSRREEMSRADRTATASVISNTSSLSFSSISGLSSSSSSNSINRISSSRREEMSRDDRTATASVISNTSSLSFSSISGLSSSSSSNSSSRRTLNVTTNATVVSDGDDGDDEKEQEDDDDDDDEEEEEEGEGRYSRASSPTRCPHHLRHISSPHLDMPRKRVPHRRSTMAHQQTCSLHRHLPLHPLGVLMVFRWRHQHTRQADDTSQDISSSIYDRPWPTRPKRDAAVQASPSVEDWFGQSQVVDASDGEVSSGYQRYLGDSGVSQASQCGNVVLAAGDCSGRGEELMAVDANDGGELTSSERQTEAHQSVVDALRQIGQSSHDVVPDGRGDALVTSLCLGAAGPEEGVAGIQLPQLTLLGEPGRTG
ncbi:hypothetical protein SprV_0301259700 [Sparganum proliferum]